jgi:hypothetical protein
MEDNRINVQSDSKNKYPFYYSKPYRCVQRQKFSSPDRKTITFRNESKCEVPNCKNLSGTFFSRDLSCNERLPPNSLPPSRHSEGSNRIQIRNKIKTNLRACQVRHFLQRPTLLLLVFHRFSSSTVCSCCQSTYCTDDNIILLTNELSTSLK